MVFCNDIKYKIEGGYPVVGKIKSMGAKNLATKSMVASILSNEVSYIHNVPNIGDVDITREMLLSLGAKVEWQDDGTLMIDPSGINNSIVTLEDSRRNRVPILLLSILLSRFKEVEVPVVGGDRIGRRDVNFHIQALESFGAKVLQEDNKYKAFLTEELHAANITLPYPSVGATETCLFLAVLAKGKSVIRNVAIEPEIEGLVSMLRSMGAIILLNGNRNIVVEGVKTLRGSNMHLIGDRIDAASWALLACATNGSIRVEGIRAELLNNFLFYYNLVGGGYKFISKDCIEFYRESRNIRHVMVETGVYPGFATDMQQPFATLLTQADGMSVIHETVYEDRMGYVEVLNKLGANIQVIDDCLGSSKCRYKNSSYKHSAIIQGITELFAPNEQICVPDIRAGLAYFIAVVIAKGVSTLGSAEEIERGYGDLICKLKDTNINIEKI